MESFLQGKCPLSKRCGKVNNNTEVIPAMLTDYNTCEYSKNW